MSQIEKVPRRRGRYRFHYQGGELEVELKKVDSVMLYGATGDLPVPFLDELAVARIPLLIHRRNMARPYIFYPAFAQGDPDVLSAQVLARENGIRRTYIARTLLRERFRKFERLISISGATYKKLTQARSIDKLRQIEAQTSQRYWRAFHEHLGESANLGRRAEHPINKALDAGSFFLFGVLLRWVLFHRMSPTHGYLHEPVAYPALCYDLMEPYRYLIEEAVAAAHMELEESLDERLTAAMFVKLKETLTTVTYIPLTRQRVMRKGLLHGIVLALRSYLIGETSRFLVPTEGQRHAGRPRKVAFRLPGHRVN